MLDKLAMPAPDTLVDYGEGSFGPAMFHYATEGCSAKNIAAENGFEITNLMLEDTAEEGSPAALAVENGEPSSVMLPLWTPPDLGDGWKLSGRFDSDDGPVALYLRPLKREGAPA